MPNWKVHIEVGKRLNEKLNYNKEDLNLFLLGSILPDINNCYIVTNISKRIDHDTTHMGKFNETSYLNFYNKYKKEIAKNNPLFVGYLAHLYTDYSWNIDFYKNFANLDIPKEERDKLRIMKQSDFKVYNNKFIENKIDIENINRALDEIIKISEISITREDILEVIDFLKNQKAYENELQFYSMEKLDELMSNTIKGCKDLLQI